MRLVAVFVLLLAVGLLAGCASPAQQAPDQTPADTENQQSPDGQDSAPADDTANTGEQQSPNGQSAPAEDSANQPDRTIELTGENYAFYLDGEENPTITVQQGDLVRVEFSSTQGFHDFVIDAFGAATEQVSAQDGTTTVEFVADEAGEFEYYCSVGSHRQQGMFGTFVVE